MCLVHYNGNPYFQGNAFTVGLTNQRKQGRLNLQMQLDSDYTLKCFSKQVFRRLNEHLHTTEHQADLLLEETVEDEDEHPLQSVEDGEEVRHHDGGVVEEEQAEGPGQPEQAEEDERPRHPWPVKRRRRW